ncbi:hypothetical protein [Stutzerimonas balearica]
MSLSWMVMLFSSFAAMLLMLLGWLQWLRCKAQCVELDVLRG